MNCKKCDKTIEPDSKFCIHCGEPQEVIKINYKGGNLERFSQNDRWGYKDKDTREVIVQPKYSSANKYSEKRAVVQYNGRYAILDQNGNELTSNNFEFIFDFCDGFARAQRDKLWAFIDTSGKEITPFKYDKLENFKGEFAKGVLGSFYCLINRKGKEVTQVHILAQNGQ